MARLPNRSERDGKFTMERARMMVRTATPRQLCKLRDMIVQEEKMRRGLQVLDGASREFDRVQPQQFPFRGGQGQQVELRGAA